VKFLEKWSSYLNLTINQMKKHYLLICMLVMIILPTSLQAHKPNQSFVYLRIYEDGIGGKIEITTDDLNRALGLDLKRGVKMEELRPYLPQIQDYCRQHVAFSSEAGNYPIRFVEPSFLRIDFADFVLLHFNLEDMNEVPDKLNIFYDALFEVDPTHRGLQGIEYDWKAGIHKNEANISLIFSPGNTDQQLDLTESSVMLGFLAMIRSGTHHIYIGLDHVLFLLALLLPSVVRRVRPQKKPLVSEVAQVTFFPNFLKPYANAWVPAESFKSSIIYVIKIVTFFTIAHTVTLSLAALEIIKLPSALVESIIAISIALAAFHNIYPLVQGREWIIAFVFGLFHGFGFASVLGDIGLTGEFMTLSLLGFNIGVEIGQIIIICILFPILFFLGRKKVYKPILVYGSMFLVIISVSWFLDRSMGINLPIGDNLINDGYIAALRLLGIN